MSAASASCTPVLRNQLRVLARRASTSTSSTPCPRPLLARVLARGVERELQPPPEERLRIAHGSDRLHHLALGLGADLFHVDFLPEAAPENSGNDSPEEPVGLAPRFPVASDEARMKLRKLGCQLVPLLLVHALHRRSP